MKGSPVWFNSIKRLHLQVLVDASLIVALLLIIVQLLAVSILLADGGAN